MSFNDLISKFHETDVTIDYLKMDIEGSEWGSLQTMLRSDVLSRVKQLGFEIHMKQNTSLPVMYKYWTILHQLEKQGFRRWYWAMNFQGSSIYMVSTGSRSYAYEMVYINVRFLHKDLK